ncbi:unnamed protein product [Candida verbasci]|uniref:Mediator of RNA polymerase II transcription subunit 12 n=1 Tax=Candida verbasci TaxID=1227364 RepID=A0A9W4XBA8_9ASCO|nr:unnamed protein product [Candida verbasci]
MSKPRSRNTLLSSQNRSSYTNSNKDEILSMKYSMIKPDLPIYPLNDEISNQELTYPDFMPWKDHTKINKESEDSSQNNSSSYLNKGYFEVPQVANEYYSARNLIGATAFVSTDNCNNVLKELSQHLTNAYKTRNEIINKIKFDSNHFRVPARVTLTASKKELWLKDLSNSNVPLKKIAEKIPHGIRNKILIEFVCVKFVPINRALWFTKSVLYGELLSSRKKHQSKFTSTESIEKFEIHWLQEWTQQVVDYVYKFSKESTTITTNDKKDQYMKKLSYLITYLSSLYVESLVDKSYFLTLLLKFLREGLPLSSKNVSELVNSENEKQAWEDEIDLNFGQRLVAITLIKVFWNEMIKYDYLLKELGELLLLNYFFINKVSDNKLSLPENLKYNILKSISILIIYLFKFNTNAFIISSSWLIVGNSLVEILLEDSLNKSEKEQEIISKQLEIIKYRNESLILNTRQSSTEEPIFMKRKSEDVLKILENLDNLKLTEEFTSLIKPTNLKRTKTNWKLDLKITLFWCITPWRTSEQSNESILIICNFLKKNIQLKINSKSLKQEFENEILDIIYHIVETHEEIKLDQHKLYVLMNELYHLNIISIGSYLRRLIASGVFYTAPGEVQDLENLPNTVKLHLDVLKNLPIMNNRQCDSILKKWSSSKFDLKEMITSCQTHVQTEILDKIFTSKFDSPLSESFVNYTLSLNVGLRFYLINWLTNEFRDKVRKSSKLLHLSHVQIANLYNFYAICDNLTVFFKSIIQTILKNESKLVIYYLDSLYLISRLVLSHFKLIKSIPSNSPNQEASTGFEIFKLLIQNYKDLSTREYDYFNFNQVWNFIDSVIEKNSTAHKPVESKTSKKVLENLLSKNTMETPMQINTTTYTQEHNNKSSEYRYSSDDFRNDLENLKKITPSPLTQDEKEEDVQLNTDLDLHQQLSGLFDGTLERTEAEETVKIKILKSTIASINLDNPIASTEILHEFLGTTLNSDADFQQKKVFIEKLIVYDIFQVEDLIKLDFKNLNYAILLNDGDDNLTPSQNVLLKITISLFHEKNFNEVMSILVHGILNDNLLQNYQSKVFQWLQKTISTSNCQLYDQLFSKLNKETSIFILSKLFLLNDEQISTIDDFKTHFSSINEFNFSICQVLLNVVIRSVDELESFVNNLLHHISFNFSSHNSYFGELFNLLSWEYKVTGLKVLENVFFNSVKFHECSVSLKIKNVNILPPLNDYFHKVLSSSVNLINDSGILDNLSTFTNSLLQLLNTPNLSDATDISTTITIFIRILIIHKETICDVIYNGNGDQTVANFVKQLVDLLNTDFFNQHEKLKILLYDLLLLMKATLTTNLTHEPDNKLEGTSPESTDDNLKNDTISRSSLQVLFDLPKPVEENPFKNYRSDMIKCSIMLDEDELKYGGDVSIFNESGLILKNMKINNAINDSFVSNIVTDSRSNEDDKSFKSITKKYFKITSFQILEDSSQSLNDGCLNLQLFDAYVTKENPQ